MNNKFTEVANNCNRRLPQIGDVYIHFKGMKVLIVALAIHTETEEPLIVYRHDDDIWARPLGMFLSEVDRAKYPYATQIYRLERELPWHITESAEFKQMVEDISNLEMFHESPLSEIEDYVLRHYYL